MDTPHILVITGLSGSGKTVALRAIEDCGFYCADNIPPPLIGSFAETVTERMKRAKLALGIDIRDRVFIDELEGNLKPLRARYRVEVLFLEAEADVLINRFKETRRPHPLMSEIKDLEEAIIMEKTLLTPLRAISDRVVDTSPFTPHQLRHHIMSLFGAEKPGQDMNITLMSFGFKYGAPKNLDLQFDVRFLPNPHFVPELKGLTGLDAPVREFVMRKEETEGFIARLSGMMDYLIPLYKKEGRAYLTIGIGCTGGRHRSAAVTEELAAMLKKQNIGINIVHRDLQRDA